MERRLALTAEQIRSDIIKGPRMAKPAGTLLPNWHSTIILIKFQATSGANSIAKRVGAARAGWRATSEADI